MKFLINGSKEVNVSTVITQFGQSNHEAVQKELQYRADKFIGKPQATEKYSVAELEKMGMIGIYLIDGELGCLPIPAKEDPFLSNDKVVQRELYGKIT